MKSSIPIITFLLLIYGCFDTDSKNFDFKNFDGNESDLNRIKKTLISFYSNYTQGNTEEMYKLEAPHFRFIYDNYGLYNTFNNRKDRDELLFKFKSIKKVTQFRYKTSIDICKKDNNCRYNSDDWIDIGGKIYHLTVDPIFFKEK